MDTKTEGSFEGYCIVEIMGYRKLGGYVREAVIAAAPFIRLDVFDETEEITATQFYSPSSIYCITPTTKEIAIAFGLRNQPAPVQQWELDKFPAPALLLCNSATSDDVFSFPF